jgi:hypothetical protein
MRKLVALALLAALPACGHGDPPVVQTITIWAPSDDHFVRTLTYDEPHQQLRSTWLNVSRTFALPRSAFPAVPLGALQWVAKHGGFDQPIATVEDSDIVGVRVAMSDGEQIETRFASAWSYDEPAQLKSVQAWYSDAAYKAESSDRGAWHLALSRAVSRRNIKQIRFAHKAYTLVVNANGTAQIAVRSGKRRIAAHGRFDWRALVPIYNAALSLRERAPVLAARGPATRVVIVTRGRTFIATGADDEGLAIFSARMDQLAHDIHWNRRVDV